LLSLSRIADGARVAIRAARSAKGCPLIALDDRGHFDGDDGAMPLVAVRAEEDLERTPMISSGPAVEGLRRPGLFAALLKGR
jgi:hypothetical protein